MRTFLFASIAFLTGVIGLACGSSDPVECVYATSCHKTDCNGAIVQSGCNVKCGPGEVDDLQCHGGKDAAADGASDAKSE